MSLNGDCYIFYNTREGKARLKPTKFSVPLNPKVKALGNSSVHCHESKHFGSFSHHTQLKTHECGKEFD